MSISAYVTTPYFEDPINRAAEQAWASGITVIAAAEVVILGEAATPPRLRPGCLMSGIDEGIQLKVCC